MENQQENELQKFDHLRKDILVLLAPIKNAVVNNEESKISATTTRKKMKEFLKEVKKTEDELCDPLKKRIDRIKAYTFTIKEPMATADKILENQLIEWERGLERERERLRAIERAEQRKREEAAAELIRQQKEEAETLALFAESPEVAAETLANAQVEATRINFEATKEHWDRSKEIKNVKVNGATRRWTHKVENPELVPDEFWIIDETKIRAYYLAKLKLLEPHEVNGVHIFQELSVPVR